MQPVRLPHPSHLAQYVTRQPREKALEDRRVLAGRDRLLIVVDGAVAHPLHGPVLRHEEREAGLAIDTHADGGRSELIFVDLGQGGVPVGAVEGEGATALYERRRPRPRLSIPRLPRSPRSLGEVSSARDTPQEQRDPPAHVVGRRPSLGLAPGHSRPVLLSPCFPVGRGRLLLRSSAPHNVSRFSCAMLRHTGQPHHTNASHSAIPFPSWAIDPSPSPNAARDASEDGRIGQIHGQ